MKDYEPFGPEWEKEIMRMRKKDIIGFFKEACIEKEILKKRLNKAVEHEQDRGLKCSATCGMRLANYCNESCDFYPPVG